MADKKKIMVVLPAQGGSRALGENVAFALERLYHSVAVFDIAEIKRNLTVKSDTASLIADTSKKLIAEIDKNVPDILLVIALAPVEISAIRAVRERGVITAHYFCEDLITEEFWMPIIREYDYFFVIQKDSWLSKCRSFNSSSFYLPNGAPVEFINGMPLEKKYDLVFVGAPYGNRIAFLEKLIATNIDFKVFGWGWNRVPLSSELRNRVIGNGEWLSYKDIFNIYANSRIVLNLHSTLSGNEIDAHGDFVNPRSFTIPLARALQLADRRSSLFEFFTEGMDIVCFSSVDELVQKVHYYLLHPEAIDSIVDNSIATITKSHLLTHRMEQMISIMDNCESKKTFNEKLVAVKTKFKAGIPINDMDMIVLLAEDIRIRESASEVKVL